ncbi:MAG: class I SAM-dependent methyltransferase [Polyangiaceae bacterium]
MGAPKSNPVVERLLYRFADENVVLFFQRRYVKYFSEAGCKSVVDLGCGRGLFLRLLKEAGIAPTGVDGSAEVVEACRKAGFDRMYNEDVLTFLRNAVARGDKFDGVFCSHLIEHLESDAAVELLQGIADILNPGGRLVLATPNINHPEVASNIFWLDLTHVRPYPRQLLEAIVSELGMKVVASFDDPETRRPYFKAWREARKLPGDLLRYGSRILSGTDAIVVASR